MVGRYHRLVKSDEYFGFLGCLRDIALLKSELARYLLLSLLPTSRSGSASLHDGTIWSQVRILPSATIWR